MKIELFPAADRGETRIEWLESYHTFSFGDYYDPHKVQFGALRVFNDDTIAPNGGFRPHSHDNMEIVTIILKGSLEHRDSMGNRGVIREWEVQRMSAGKGVKHAEYNPSAEVPVHLLQIWIVPQEKGIDPSYEQKSFDQKMFTNRFCTQVSPDGVEGSLHIHCAASFKRGIFDKGTSCELVIAKDQALFIFVSSGEIAVAGVALRQGDAIGIADTDKLLLQNKQKSDIIAILLPLRLP